MWIPLGDSPWRQIDHFIWIFYVTSDKADKYMENDEWKKKKGKKRKQTIFGLKSVLMCSVQSKYLFSI